MSIFHAQHLSKIVVVGLLCQVDDDDEDDAGGDDDAGDGGESGERGGGMRSGAEDEGGGGLGNEIGEERVGGNGGKGRRRGRKHLQKAVHTRCV